MGNAVVLGFLLLGFMRSFQEQRTRQGNKVGGVRDSCVFVLERWNALERHYGFPLTEILSGGRAEGQGC